MNLKVDDSLSRKGSPVCPPRIEVLQYPPRRIFIINCKVEVAIRTRLKMRRKKEKN